MIPDKKLFYETPYYTAECHLVRGPQAASLVSAQEPDGGQRPGAHGRRQAGGEDEAAAVAAHHVHQRRRGRDEAAHVAVRLPCGPTRRVTVGSRVSRHDSGKHRSRDSEDVNNTALCAGQRPVRGFLFRDIKTKHFYLNKELRIMVF